VKRVPTRDILFLFLATRLALLLVTYFGYVLLTAPKYSSIAVDSAFFTSWNHWDAANYTRIAQYGYQTRYDVAFFPLFPLLIASVAHPLGTWSYIVVGMLISNAAFLGALFVVYLLAVDSGSDQMARRAILYLSIFPTAFFFFAAYNESLFVLLTASTFLALRRRCWWLAGVLGLLAALTRATAVLLVVPYLYELWVAREQLVTSCRTLLFALLPLLLIPLGTALYCLYCWHIRGDPFAFATLQYHWARHLSWPWDGIWQSLFQLLWNQPFGSFYQAHVLLDFGATLALITLVILGWRKLRLRYALWALLLVLSMLLNAAVSQDPLVSDQRFILEVFPAFITLAMLGVEHPRLHQALLLFFPTLLATLSLLFVMNRWMV
jgi:Gpi18-like mannosyltransferase